MFHLNVLKLYATWTLRIAFALCQQLSKMLIVSQSIFTSSLCKHLDIFPLVFALEASSLNWNLMPERKKLKLSAGYGCTHVKHFFCFATSSILAVFSLKSFGRLLTNCLGSSWVPLHLSLSTFHMPVELEHFVCGCADSNLYANQNQ